MPKVLPPGEKVFLIEDVKDVCKAYNDAQKKPKFIIFSSQLTNTCIVLMILDWQYGREMHTRVMLSIDGVCESCQESHGTTIMCGMMT